MALQMAVPQRGFTGIPIYQLLNSPSRRQTSKHHIFAGTFLLTFIVFDQLFHIHLAHADSLANRDSGILGRNFTHYGL